MVVRLLTEKTTKNILIILFICVGIALMGIRWIYFDVDRVLEEDTAWKISLAGRIEAEKDKTIIYSAKPKSGRYNKVISQRFYHPSFRLKTAKPGNSGKIAAKATRTGKTEFQTEYHIQISQAPHLITEKKSPLSIPDREKYLLSDTSVDLKLQSLVNLSEFLGRGINTKPELLSKIFSYSQKLVKVPEKKYDEIQEIIRSNKATTLGRARIMLALSRINDIPARIVTGFVLTETVAVKPYYWVEIYTEEEHWQPYDPEKGFKRELPHTYIAFTYDDPNLLTVENGKLLETSYTIDEDSEILNVTRFQQEKDFFDIFDLRRLDIDTRDALIKVLLLPFCVLLTAVFRHVLGFFPYGTFTASLLALAMVYAETLVTLIIATIVIFLALIGRSILPKTCPRAPRLSLIFTFVALSMVFSVSTLSYFSISPGGNIILLPTIILVAIVDRFYSYMDQGGTHAALLRLGVTILIAAFCVPILQFEELGIFILTYPEAHLLTAAAVLLLAGYKGKKLTDYKYLRLLGENKVKKSAKRKSDADIV